MSDTLRIVTWNIFHARSHAASGPRWPIRERTHADDGYLRVTGHLPGPVGTVLRRLGADIALLQEVPPAMVGAIAAAAGMHAGWQAETGPQVGPRRARHAIGRIAPQLVRTHEGNANVILVGPGLRLCPDSARGVRLNRRADVWRTWHDPARDLTAGGAWRWLREPRVAVAGRVQTPSGAALTIATTHLHNARGQAEPAHEVARLADFLGTLPDPLVMGGDLNLTTGAPALEHVAAAGLVEDDRDPTIGIDRIYTRGVTVVGGARRGQPADREVEWHGRGGRGRVLVSDHDPVWIDVRVSR